MIDEALGLRDVGGSGGEDGGENELVLFDLLLLIRDGGGTREGAIHGRYLCRNPSSGCLTLLWRTGSELVETRLRGLRVSGRSILVTRISMDERLRWPR